MQACSGLGALPGAPVFTAGSRQQRAEKRRRHLTGASPRAYCVSKAMGRLPGGGFSSLSTISNTALPAPATPRDCMGAEMQA